MRQTDKVIFRQFIIGCEIIALFPEIPGTNNPADCLSYMRIGQHGAANIAGVIQDTKPAPSGGATAKLQAELEAIGYNLEVKKRYTYTMAANKLRLLQVPL